MIDLNDKTDKTKRVLLIGAFGNIGLSTLEELLTRGFDVLVFDLPNRKNRRKFRTFKKVWTDKITAKWGDLREYKDVESAMENIGTVIHLGAIIPPLSEVHFNRAFEVNVGGTLNVIKAMETKAPDAHLIFSSSFTIFGVREENPIISLEDSFNPKSNYAMHKIECERMIQSSTLKWTILRFTWVPSLNDLKLFRFMFDVPLETKIEILIPEDAVLSLLNAIDNPNAIYNIFNISGGKSCRTRYGEYLMNMFEIFGLGTDPIPAEAFSHEGTFGGWIEPQGSQRVLRYQRTTLDDYYDNLRKKYRLPRFLINMVKSLAARIVIKQSPYVKNFTSFHSISEYLDSTEDDRFTLETSVKPIQEAVV